MDSSLSGTTIMSTPQRGRQASPFFLKFSSLSSPTSARYLPPRQRVMTIVESTHPDGLDSTKAIRSGAREVPTCYG
jgi:hypothetical protein